MSPDPVSLAQEITRETGLPFSGKGGMDRERNRWITFTLSDHDQAQTFAIRVILEWRRITIRFEPGKFAGPLLEAMSDADPAGRAVFLAVMEDSVRNGAAITFRPNGIERKLQEQQVWQEAWNRLDFSISRGGIELGTDDGVPDNEIVRAWTSRFVAAVIALLPLERHEDDELQGYPEGAVERVEVNRYERDRRNRSAALAIHGCRCSACGMSFGDVYGSAAAGFIEVHHVVPVSQIDENYVIDPLKDLIPLCSNCHSVAHRQSPPYGVQEIKGMIERTRTARSED